MKSFSSGMIFEKSSTRTRVSFETGIYYLGGMGLFLSKNDLQIGRGEPVSDTARVLSRFVDGIMIRTFSHQGVEELAHYASVPVINGLTDLLHPCQVLADLQTIREHKKGLRGLKLTYVGAGNNMAHSLMLGGAKMGMQVTISCPEDYLPDEEIYVQARNDAKSYGGAIELESNPQRAVEGADVLYTDVWASMGEEAEQQERARILSKYQINDSLLACAKPDAVVMHCLPAKRGQEISHEVIEGSQSIVFDQSENRLWAQMSVMALLMADKQRF